jgi:hypothetical protein
MISKLTIAASIALALSTAACSGMPHWPSGDSSASASMNGDPAGTANSGTGSVMGEGGSGREAFSSGEGLD